MYLEYRNSEEKLDALRAAVRAAGIKRIARMSGVPRSQLCQREVQAKRSDHREDRGRSQKPRRVVSTAWAIQVVEGLYGDQRSHRHVERGSIF
jgi:hypothetical protein